MRDQSSPRQSQMTAAVTAYGKTRHVETTIVILLVIALFAGAWLSGRETSPSLQTQRVKVHAGDTLWSLARAYPTPGDTTAETVHLLAQINDIEGEHLITGTVLKVPVDAPRGSQALAMR